MAPKALPWPRNFRPNPNSFGVQFEVLSAQIAPGPTFTGTATTTVYVGVPKARQFYVYNAAMQGPTAFTGASAVTAQLIRKNNTGTPTDVTLTAATSLKSDVITGTDNNVEWTIGATNPNCFVQPGDTLRWEIVATGTITAGNLVGVVETGIIN